MSHEASKRKKSPSRGQQRGAAMVPAMLLQPGNLEQIFKVIGVSKALKSKRVSGSSRMCIELEIYTNRLLL